MITTTRIFFFKDSPPPTSYTLSLHDALPISTPDTPFTCLYTASTPQKHPPASTAICSPLAGGCFRSEEHTSELQSRGQLVCRLLLGKTSYTWFIHVDAYNTISLSDLIYHTSS